MLTEHGGRDGAAQNAGTVAPPAGEPFPHPGIQRRAGHLTAEWDEASDAVLVVDHHNDVVFHNKAALSLLPAGARSIGLSLQAVLPGAPAHLSQLVKDTLVTGRPHRADWLDGTGQSWEATICQAAGAAAILLRPVRPGNGPAGEAGPRAASLLSSDHETRTLLSGILGYAELLLNDRHLTPSQRNSVQGIHTAGVGLLAMANDVLNAATADAGELLIEVSPFGLKSVIEAASSMARHQATSKGLTFECVVAPDVPSHLAGDAERLRQVLHNLLANAVRYTHQGRVRLSVDVSRRSDRAAQIEFAVADTGIGIPPERQAALLREAHVHSDARAGGRGFHVAKAIVERMGGALRLESQVDLGTKVAFSVELPVQGSASPPAMPRAQRSSAKILLVEDNDINRDIARAILEAAGHQVDLACDGSVAVSAVQSNSYHVVLMDVQMPIMDGVSATRIIRSLPGPECDVPIIALSANVLPEQVRAFKAAGMNDHMGKPFKRDQLLDLVNRWAFDGINRVIHNLNAPAALRMRG